MSTQAPRRSPRRHQGSTTFTVASDTPDTSPVATSARTRSGTRKLTVKINGTSTPGSREASILSQASVTVKAEPVEVSLTPSTVTWPNAPTLTRVKSETLDFEPPTATQTSSNKRSTSKGKKNGRTGGSKGNQNSVIKTDQTNDSMMSDEGSIPLPSFLEYPNPEIKQEDLVTMDPPLPAVFYKSTRFVPGAFTDTSKSSPEPDEFASKLSKTDILLNIVIYTLTNFYAIPVLMFVFWYCGWDVRYGAVAGFASPFSFPSQWALVTRLRLAGLVEDTPLKSAAYLDVIPMILDLCVKYLASTRAVNAISRNPVLTTTQIPDKFKINLTVISEKKVKEVHDKMQKRRGQPHKSRFDENELEAHQTFDNPAWNLWIKFRNADPINAMKKFMDCLGLPCSVFSLHFETKEESVEHASFIENTTPTKKRGNACGPVIVLVDGCEPVAPSALSKRDLEAYGWRLGERLRSTLFRIAQYLDLWEGTPCGDITLPVHEPAVEDGQHDLTSGIVKYLEAEREKMKTAILSLPVEWKTYGGKPPPHVLLPAPYKVLKTKANCSSEYYGQEALSPAYSYKEAMKKDFPASPKPTREEHDLMCSLVTRFSLHRPEEEIIQGLPDLIDEVDKHAAPRRTYDANQALVKKLSSTPGANQVIEWLPPDRFTGCGKRSANPIYEFLNYHNTKEASTEMVIESGTGHYIHEILFDDEMDGARNATLKYSCHLRALGSNPRPDSYMRVPANSKLPWHPSLMPIIYVGEAKRQETGKTEAQLAAAYNATLSLLVLYYLDTRPSLDAALPNWLHLYGITYMDFGFKIYAFYPHYRFGDNRGWGFTSCLVTDHFEYVFRDGSVPDRCHALAALHRAKAHGYYIVGRLQKWENCRNALAPFEQQAVDESYW